MQKSILISLLIAFMTLYLSSVSLAMLTPAVDGHYTYWEYVCCDNFDGDSYVSIGIRVAPYYSSNYIWCGWMCDEGYSESLTNGIIEFNISSVEGLFTSGQIQAYLYLTAKDLWLHGEKCFSIYSIHDENENGIIEVHDEAYKYIGDACIDLQVGDTITFHVTSAVEHDLFGPDQTSFSGFVIRISSESSGYPDDYMEFYDHTDPTFAPRLSISERLCPMSLIYGEHSKETQLLRSIRDNILSKSHEGKELIKLYYQWSAVIVRAMEQDKDFKEDVKGMIDEILGIIEVE